MTFPVANVLQPLINVCESIMVFFHDHLLVSWGMAIVLLTVTIRLVILPLTFRQVRSMQSLQRLQPQIKAIQERYKDDKQRQQQEMMKFYQENKVNPLGSCLPILLQLPFFFALFYMLRHDLRLHVCPGQNPAHPCGDIPAAHFLFIPDITNKATGAVLIVLIALYVGTQLISGLITTFTADRSQRIMMLALPFVFVTFVINFPAGLIVYWITTNLWTIGQQLAIKRFLPPPEPLPAGAAAVTGASKSPAKGAKAVPAKAGRDDKPAKADKSAKAEKSGASSNGAEATKSTPPPPGPRKKKKRSGRRR